MPVQLLPFFHKMTGHAAVFLAGAGGLAAVDFRDQLTIASIVVTCVVLVIAGLFTIRSKIASVWREDAEGQRAAKDHLQEQLSAERLERVEFGKQQQELRHELKNELAAARAQLQVMEARTDLTAALDSIRQMNVEMVASISTSITHAIRNGGSEERDRQTHRLLEEIRDRFPPLQPPPVS